MHVERESHRAKERRDRRAIDTIQLAAPTCLANSTLHRIMLDAVCVVDLFEMMREVVLVSPSGDFEFSLNVRSVRLFLPAGK